MNYDCYACGLPLFTMGNYMEGHQVCLSYPCPMFGKTIHSKDCICHLRWLESIEPTWDEYAGPDSFPGSDYPDNT